MKVLILLVLAVTGGTLVYLRAYDPPTGEVKTTLSVPGQSVVRTSPARPHRTVPPERQVTVLRPSAPKVRAPEPYEAPNPQVGPGGIQYWDVRPLVLTAPLADVRPEQEGPRCRQRGGPYMTCRAWY